MKKYFSIAIMALAILWCTALSAAPGPVKLLLKTQTVENTHLVVHLANLRQLDTEVTLTDLTGGVFTRQTVTDHNGYSFNLDLRQVPAGRYLLTVTQKGQTIKQVVYKDDDVLMVSHAKAAR